MRQAALRESVDRTGAAGKLVMKKELTSERDDILEEALDVVPEELALFLDRRCGENADLRQDVERLLAANRRMNDEFLEGTAARWTVPILELGQRLGRYEIEDIIASGGMSVVYRGRDIGIGRTVAIKVLMPTAGVGAKAHSRFLSEVRILGSIRHPNVVQIFDFGDLDGVYYIVMEYLEGKDLAQANAAGSGGDIAWKLEVARQLAAALQHVHMSGIIHRDIKPANIFIEPSGAVKLMDFGISRLDGPGMNQTTSFVGTLEYLPPEQVRGESPSQRSDIYSYGIVLFEFFTGRKAYTGSAAEVLYRVAHEDLPLEALRAADIPRPLAALIRSATRKKPSDRPGSFEEILLSLTSLQADKSPVTPGALAGKITKIVAVGLAVCSLAIWIRLATLPDPGSTKKTSVFRSRPAQARDGREVITPVPGENAPVAFIPVPHTPLARTQKQPASFLPVPAESGVKTPARPLVASQKVSEFGSPLTPTGDPAATPLARLEIPSLAPRQAEQVLQRSVPLHSEQGSVSETISPGAPKLPKTPDETETRSRAQVEILTVLQGYLAAYNAKDMRGISALFPAMTDSARNKLISAFSVAKSVELNLTPQGEPLVELLPSGTPRSARVRCKRLLRMTPFGGRTPKPQIDVCVFRFEYVGGAWKIVSQE
jgi:serine/threonine protein kinase